MTRKNIKAVAKHRERMTPEARRQSILSAALEVAAKTGYLHMTRAQVAEKAKCSVPLIPLHFGNIANLQDEVVAEAIRTRNLAVVAQAIVNKHKRCSRLSPELKNAARQAI